MLGEKPVSKWGRVLETVIYARKRRKPGKKGRTLKGDGPEEAGPVPRVLRPPHRRGAAGSSSRKGKRTAKGALYRMNPRSSGHLFLLLSWGGRARDGLALSLPGL